MAGFRIPAFSMFESLAHSNKNLAKAGWIVAPTLERCGGLTKRHDLADRLLDGKLPLLEHCDHSAEVFRSGVAGAQNVQLLLNKEPRFVAHRFFYITDVDHSPGERHLLHCCA